LRRREYERGPPEEELPDIDELNDTAEFSSKYGSL
jgi:hypothetical protein